MLDGDVRTLTVDAADIRDFTEFTGHAHPLALADIVSKSRPIPTAFYIRPEDEDNVARRIPVVTPGWRGDHLIRKEN
jgi:DNA (cytosine-5)-methyltransferase 1